MFLWLTVRVILHYGQDILILCYDLRVECTIMALFLTKRQARASSREAISIGSQKQFQLEKLQMGLTLQYSVENSPSNSTLPPRTKAISPVHHGSPEADREAPIHASAFQRGNNGQVWRKGGYTTHHFSKR